MVLEYHYIDGRLAARPADLYKKARSVNICSDCPTFVRSDLRIDGEPDARKITAKHPCEGFKALGKPAYSISPEYIEDQHCSGLVEVMMVGKPKDVQSMNISVIDVQRLEKDRHAYRKAVQGALRTPATSTAEKPKL